MNSTTPYIMHDQAKGLISKLADFDARNPQGKKNHFKELVVFLFAAMGYLLALGLAT